jgi:hypothetical protein
MQGIKQTNNYDWKYRSKEIDKFDSYNKTQTNLCEILIKQIIIKKTKTDKCIHLTAVIKTKLN